MAWFGNEVVNLKFKLHRVIRKKDDGIPTSSKMLSPTFRYIHPAFEIPTVFQATLFPNASLSILEFLEFHLPVISGIAPRHDTQAFFSSDDPTVDDVNILRNITIPHLALSVFNIQLPLSYSWRAFVRDPDRGFFLAIFGDL